MILRRSLSSILAASLVLGSFSSALAAQGAAPAQTPVQPSAAPSYKLGPEDVISIVVLRHPEFSTDLLVPSSGIVQVPAVGDVNVNGMTLDALRVKIAKKLDDRIYNPEVTVSLKLQRMQRFYVLGDVRNSGVYDLKPGWTVAEGLTASGGLTPTLEQRDTRIVLEHTEGGEKKVIRMPLEEALRKSDDPSLHLEPGDVLRIEAIPTFPVYISGKVKTPGMYRLRDDSTSLLNAISQAGGTSDDASLTNVRIVRIDGSEEVIDLTPSLVRGESAKLPSLHGGDMVIVSESTERIAVLGYVSKPGYFPVPQGRKVFLSDAIAMAQGGDKRASLTKVGLMRTEGGKQVRKVYDLGKFLRAGDTSQNPEVTSGDVVYVPETNRAETSLIIGSLTSVGVLLNAMKR